MKWKWRHWHLSKLLSHHLSQYTLIKISLWFDQMPSMWHVFIYAGVNERGAFRSTFGSNFLQETLRCIENMKMKHKTRFSFKTSFRLYLNISQLSHEVYAKQLVWFSMVNINKFWDITKWIKILLKKSIEWKHIRLFINVHNAFIWHYWISSGWFGLGTGPTACSYMLN